MDAPKLRGVHGAVKHGKRPDAAFGDGCIINATRRPARSFTIVLQDNYRKFHRGAAFMHQIVHVAIKYA
jgi:hypothetical protein